MRLLCLLVLEQAVEVLESLSAHILEYVKHKDLSNLLVDVLSFTDQEHLAIAFGDLGSNNSSHRITGSVPRLFRDERVLAKVLPAN